MFPTYRALVRSSSQRRCFDSSFQSLSEVNVGIEGVFIPSPALPTLVCTASGSMRAFRDESASDSIDPRAFPGAQPCLESRRWPIFDSGKGVGAADLTIVGASVEGVTAERFTVDIFRGDGEPDVCRDRVPGELDRE